MAVISFLIYLATAVGTGQAMPITEEESERVKELFGNLKSSECDMIVLSQATSLPYPGEIKDNAYHKKTYQNHKNTF